MSYCRWSSNDWDCDLYCYQDGSGGWTTWVASNRVANVPKIGDMPVNKTRLKRWFKGHQDQMKFLETAKRKPIGLPFDGDHYNDPTLEAFKNRLLALRTAGYHFPDYVLEEVDNEILVERLKMTDPAKFISSEEMKRRLG